MQGNNTTTSGETLKTEGTQEVISIRGLTFQITTKNVRVTIRPLTHDMESNSHKHILIGNAQVTKSLLPFNYTIVNQRISHNFVCFLQRPVHGVKNQIICLAPNNP